MTKNTWVNWAGGQRCTPAVVAVPRDVDELAEVVVTSAQAGRGIRVAGAGHSFTDAVLTDGTLLDLHKLNRVLDVDTANRQVRVEAGITLNAASPLLHDHGLAFPNLGDIDVQTLAGATATGTHGTGARLRNISAALASLEVLRADGTRVELNAETDAEAWRAARVSIGALGVVTAATLQLEPSFVLESIEKPVPVEEVLTNLDHFVDSNDHFEFFAFPHAKQAMTKANNRVDAPEEPRGRFSEWLNDIVLSNHFYDALCRLGRRIPATIPSIHRTAAFAGSNNRQVDRSYRVFATPRLVKFNEMEYAIERANAADAVREILEVGKRFATPMPIEVRWVAPDDAFLSPAGGRETCYIAVHQYEGMEWEPYFHACEEVFNRYAGRPHWGKRHFQTAETLAPRYPNWARFAAVRKQFDPTGVFTNDYVRRVLGE
ncbi:D-arabinono-1,4-lactone oxidase [Nocardia camponoti]|uniref:L-gulono-1,4-lactone dehydrogenase n=1 Tax=Nocardia camponoti TaxID=1616106 RepID=A0A917V6W4_9NOCA|nr:D-arabinono-1,4-lactone oxidase [Nocardia camponoti]GGK44895.1 L-gulono-1,4-lactone dehydrogenase [Nocardia camponoti]